MEGADIFNMNEEEKLEQKLEQNKTIKDKQTKQDEIQQVKKQIQNLAKADSINFLQNKFLLFKIGINAIYLLQIFKLLYIKCNKEILCLT